MFVSCSILFDKLEIYAFPGEYTFRSNWLLKMLFLGHHGISSSIRGIGDYSI